MISIVYARTVRIRLHNIVLIQFSVWQSGLKNNFCYNNKTFVAINNSRIFLICHNLNQLCFQFLHLKPIGYYLLKKFLLKLVAIEKFSV